MCRTMLFVPFIFCVSVALAEAATADAGTGLPEPGPENAGLRLRLIIIPDAQGDSKTVNVELLNSGPKAVTLVGDWDYEENDGDYAAFFQKRVGLATYPEVQPESFQTDGREREAPQPEYELASGKSLSVSWKTQGNQIRRDSPFPGTSPVFPSPGLYGVKATIVVITKEGKRILLVSNEQPMMVGGVYTLPKYATARVVRAHPNEELVMIDLGSDHRIEKGDTFVIRCGLHASWRLTVTNVGTWFSKGTITRLHHDGQPKTPAFPQERWLAALEPKREAP